MSSSNQFEATRKKLWEAGRIATKALSYTCNLVKANRLLLDIAEAGERKIRELGGRPAFPINISINHHAAHYTPFRGDTRCIPRQALVKIDLGAHVNGFIADTAQTVIIEGNAKLVRLRDATDAALQAAIQTTRAGIRVWEVSKAISKAFRRFNTRPIVNLTGHSIKRFNLHAGISIPAVAPPSERLRSPRLQEDMILAIEPFATYSTTPRVVNLEKGHIYGFVLGRNPKEKMLRHLFSQMKVEFNQLPFTSRWMKELVPPDEIESVLTILMREGCIHNYPVLGLRDQHHVAQSEHTLIVEQDGCKILTLYSDQKEEV